MVSTRCRSHLCSIRRAQRRDRILSLFRGRTPLRMLGSESLETRRVTLRYLRRRIPIPSTSRGEWNKGLSNNRVEYYRGLPRRSRGEFSIMLRLVQNVRVNLLCRQLYYEDTKLRSEKRLAVEGNTIYIEDPSLGVRL